MQRLWCGCRDDALAVAMLQVLQRLAVSQQAAQKLPGGFAGHLTEHILLPCLVWRAGRGAAVIRALCMQVMLRSAPSVLPALQLLGDITGQCFQAGWDFLCQLFACLWCQGPSRAVWSASCRPAPAGSDEVSCYFGWSATHLLAALVFPLSGKGFASCASFSWTSSKLVYWQVLVLGCREAARPSSWSLQC